jgi:mevalonate kinase
MYFGEPAIALAINMETTCVALHSNKFMVNGVDLDPQEHLHIRGALLQAWSDMDKPLEFKLSTSIKEGWGLGENASTIVSCLGTISMMRNHIIFKDLARNAYEVEREIMVEASPIDTSAAAYGGGILNSREPSEHCLWSIGQNDQWNIHQIDAEGLDFVLGRLDLGPSKRGMFSKIKRFYNRNAFARDIVHEIGDTTREGIAALRNGNAGGIGELMNTSQKALVTLGASHPYLEKIINEVRRHSFGAKVTGDVSGYCVAALTERPERVIEVFERSGGQAHHVQISTEGVRLEDGGAIFVR